MVILHETGVVIELINVIMVKPTTAPRGSDFKNVEITLTTGEKLIFSDSWWYRKNESKTVMKGSIYLAMVPGFIMEAAIESGIPV